jgi:hypothetical protein
MTCLMLGRVHAIGARSSNRKMMMNHATFALAGRQKPDFKSQV